MDCFRVIGNTRVVNPPHRLLAVLALFVLATPVGAQTCWVYTDNEQAPAPMKCVQKNNLGASCTCNPAADGSCQTDCTSIPLPPGSQTIRELHEAWHDCFGPVGGANPQPGRGNRWYAFHRQFEFDFNAWRRDIGFAPIESLEWCPNMNMPIGTAPPGTPSASPQCGTLATRPANTLCPQCTAFPKCLFKPGAGPVACPNSPSTNCRIPLGAGNVSFPAYQNLNDFKNIEEVATLLDAYFHADMHVATCLATKTPAQNCDLNNNVLTGCFNLDSLTPSCAPRDPMFWRLHHAIDDVVRAWQDEKAVDVVLVIDRSGSMSEPDVGSGTTKLSAALNAVENFADMLDKNRTDAQINRVGVVSYSDNANIDLPMTNVDIHLLDAGGPLKNALTSIGSTGPGGCTGIGAGLQKAVDILCPGGTCQNFTGAAGTNPRKAILVMTDGVENVPPCLQPAGAAGGTCSAQCFGPQFGYDNLANTQLVSVGFGSGSDLNAPLLTMVSERQGGIFIQNPNTATNDLKDFFTKAFGGLTSEFLLFDPKGTLAANQPASDPFEYSGCSDSMLTFASGWNTSVTPGELTLIVDAPNGDLVRGASPAIDSSQQSLWHYSRVRLPYKGQRSGTWRGQIIRPHQLFVNGFTTDAFAAPKDGTTLVRREIHRLCPDGCKRVLYYENGRRSPQSAYRDALKLEQQAGLVASIITAPTDVKLAQALAPNRWDLIVFAEMGPDTRHPYDDMLARLLCGGQKAIITDTRIRSHGSIFECAGVHATAQNNWSAIADNANLVDHTLKLVNHGYPVFSYGLAGASIEATATIQVGAVAARARAGKNEEWFADVLGNSLGKLSPSNRKVSWKTGEIPVAEVRMLPSNIRSGGWDKVNARVEVEYPTVGIGTLLAQHGVGGPRTVNGETIDARTAALLGITIPTAKATFPLYDDGTHGDLHAGNSQWTADLPGMGKVDGMYKLRYMLDLTANSCTTHRELVQSVFVDVGVDSKTSRVAAGTPSPQADGWRRFDVSIVPADAAGNIVGPGRITKMQCAPKNSCRIDPKPVDAERGVYRVALDVAPNVGSVQLGAFDTAFDIVTDCPNCPKLAGLKIEPNTVINNQPTTATITLSAPAPETPEGGAVVFLASDLRGVASVPPSVVVPAGKTSVTFPVTVYHVHEAAESVMIGATYGGAGRDGTLTVSNSTSTEIRPAASMIRHYHHVDE